MSEELDTSRVVLTFDDPLELMPTTTYTGFAADAMFQRIADRVRLLARHMRHPAFHDPTMEPHIVRVTRFDPFSMQPVVPQDVYAGRSTALMPCLYVGSPDFLYWLVSHGNPPVAV